MLFIDTIIHLLIYICVCVFVCVRVLNTFNRTILIISITDIIPPFLRKHLYNILSAASFEHCSKKICRVIRSYRYCFSLLKLKLRYDPVYPCRSVGQLVVLCIIHLQILFTKEQFILVQNKLSIVNSILYQNIRLCDNVM